MLENSSGVSCWTIRKSKYLPWSIEREFDNINLVSIRKHSKKNLNQVNIIGKLIDLKVYYIDIGIMSKREAILTGLQWLFETANEGDIKTCIIAIPIMDHIKDSHHDIHKALESLSSGLAQKLAKNKECAVNGIQIKLVTDKIVRYSLPKSLVLVIYPTKKMLMKLFDYGRNSKFFVIPWYMDELTESLTMVQAIDYLANEIIGQDINDLDPVIVEALKALTISVNISTGIGKGAHRSDKEKAKELFLRLKKAKYSLDVNKISTWLVSQGRWNPREMDEVKKLIDSINNRKNLRITSKMWKENIIEILKENAEKE